MKALVRWWEMGSFPWLVPYEEGEHDVRRTVEVPEDLYERLVDAHEEFCSVLAEVDVECVEILDAPDPDRPFLVWTRVRQASIHSHEPDLYAWRAVCEACGCAEEVECARPGPVLHPGDHDRALTKVISLGWRERRHGGLACAGCAPAEKVLSASAVSE